jgi:hypothetical protein
VSWSQKQARSEGEQLTFSCSVQPDGRPGCGSGAAGSAEASSGRAGLRGELPCGEVMPVPAPVRLAGFMRVRATGVWLLPAAVIATSAANSGGGLGAADISSPEPAGTGEALGPAPPSAEAEALAPAVTGISPSKS